MRVNIPGGYYEGKNAEFVNEENGNWSLEIKADGSITFTNLTYIDVFVVGGGGGGTWGSAGGGGYTKTKRGICPALNTKIPISVGHGGSSSNRGGSSSGFGVSADGGYPGTFDKGGDGGSGGATWSSMSGGLNGGSNGGNGGHKEGRTPGHGQGTTTRAFEDSNGTLFAGGGGACGTDYDQWQQEIHNRGYGGSGGGGNSSWLGSYESSLETSGTPNTGGGGGGGLESVSTGGSGGSGIVIIRNSRVNSKTYRLFIEADEGSEVSIYRTSSILSNTGAVKNGAFVYTGDLLKISFTPKANYKLISTLVNGSNFSSGNTHTVSENVNIKCVSQPLISVINATNADIGDISVLTLTRYGKTYTHNIGYEFRGTKGKIVSNYANDTFDWMIPSSFYKKMTDKGSDVCKIICETFDNGLSLGVSSTEIIITANYDKSKPLIVCSIEDIDPTTIYLTGSKDFLIRNRSDAKCKIIATPRNSATISQLSIGKNTVSDGRLEYTVSLEDFSGSVVEFKATDSRGYVTTEIIAPTIIEYINLSCYANLRRVSPTSGEIVMDVHGDFFWQDFSGEQDAISNELFLSYRYRENTTSSQYSEWVTIPQENIVKTYTNYRSINPILLNDCISPKPDFDYKKEYIFQIRAQDGVIGHILSTVIASESGVDGVIVKTGQPIFDWGKNDFNFNVPVKVANPEGIVIGEESLSEEILKNLKSLYPRPDPPKPPDPQTVSKTYKGNLSKGSWSSMGDGFYKQTLNVSGLDANNNVIVDIDLNGLTPKQCTDANDAWGAIIKVETANNVLTFISVGAPTIGLLVKVMEIFK